MHQHHIIMNLQIVLEITLFSKHVNTIRQS